MQRKQFICAPAAPSPAACARPWDSRDRTHQDQSARRRVGWGRFIGRTCSPRTVAPCSTDAERAERAGDDRCCAAILRAGARSGWLVAQAALGWCCSAAPSRASTRRLRTYCSCRRGHRRCRSTNRHRARRRLFGRHAQEVRPPPRVKLPQPWPTRAKVRVTERIAAPPSHG